MNKEKANELIKIINEVGPQMFNSGQMLAARALDIAIDVEGVDSFVTFGKGLGGCFPEHIKDFSNVLKACDVKNIAFYDNSTGAIACLAKFIEEGWKIDQTSFQEDTDSGCLHQYCFRLYREEA